MSSDVNCRLGDIDTLPRLHRCCLETTQPNDAKLLENDSKRIAVLVTTKLVDTAAKTVAINHGHTPSYLYGAASCSINNNGLFGGR